MKTRNDDLELAAELRALRPAPSDEFAAELDERAASGFRGERSTKRSRPTILFNHLRSLPARRILLPAGATALAAIVAATALIAIGKTGQERSLLSQPSVSGAPDPGRGDSGRPAGGGASERLQSEGGVLYSNAPPTIRSSPSGDNSAGGAGAQVDPATTAGARRRKVERGAQIVLGAAPADIADDAAKVFDAVHANDGVVLRSSVENGSEGTAGAEFELLIPAGKVSDALAAFSRIGEVRSRRESTLDITAPMVGARELLRDSSARIDGLLAQLASAESDDERAAVESELRRERRRSAALRSRLERLDRRADFARVSLRIETDEESGAGAGGRWGVGDALDDAAHILATGVGVTVVAVAILAPFALLTLLAWLANRAWLRRRRERALG